MCLGTVKVGFGKTRNISVGWVRNVSWMSVSCADNPGAEKGCTGVHRNGNEPFHSQQAQRLPGLLAGGSVEHRGVGARNPDASLSGIGPGNDVADRHA